MHEHVRLKCLANFGTHPYPDTPLAYAEGCFDLVRQYSIVHYR